MFVFLVGVAGWVVSDVADGWVVGEFVVAYFKDAEDG